MMADHQAMQNPLFLSEIIYRIHRHSKSRDSHNLAMTCRVLFYSLLPLLWETIWGAEKLFRLMPGVDVIQNSTTSSTMIAVNVSDSALTESWDRYWLYAPHVKCLSVYGKFSPTYKPGIAIKLHGWNILFTKRKMFEGPLLPNLRSLVICSSEPTYFEPLVPINQLAVFACFVSPSVKKLVLWDYPPNSEPFMGSSFDRGDPYRDFSSPSALLLVNNLAKTLPGCQNITLPAYYDCPSQQMAVASSSTGIRQLQERISRLNFDLPSIPIIAQESLDWFDGLEVPVGLTHLVIYSSALLGGAGEGFIILGHLPYLESLEITGTSGSKASSHRFLQREPLPIPPGLFPCLKTIRLKSMPGSQLFCHIWGSGEMVSGLTSAFIDFANGCSSITRKEAASLIVPLLWKNSPKLESLTFVAFLDDYEDTNDERSSQGDMIFDLLSHLSLSTLLFHLLEEDIPELSDRSLASPPLPSLKSLCLTIRLTPSQIITLAALTPNLEHVSILGTSLAELERSDEVASELGKPTRNQQTVAPARSSRGLPG
ncbi:unnamed protein product, partial [Rhizoctonia solani]